MKKIILIFVSIILFSCAGTGSKSDSYIPELDSILNNLYESLEDLSLFFKDLIN